MFIMSKDNYQGVLLEEIWAKLQWIAEILVPIQTDVAQLKADMAEMKADRMVMKAVITDHSKHINIHEVRITHLEAAH
jgi:hypothetical protein